MRGLITNDDVVLGCRVRDKLHIIEAPVNYLDIGVALSETFGGIAY